MPQASFSRLPPTVHGSIHYSIGQHISSDRQQHGCSHSLECSFSLSDVRSQAILLKAILLINWTPYLSPFSSILHLLLPTLQHDAALVTATDRAPDTSLSCESNELFRK